MNRQDSPYHPERKLDNSHNAWEEDPETYATAIADWVLGEYAQA
jgi:hypothetical protein